MHETAERRSDAPALGRGERQHRCHECGEPIRGIEATGPAGHRFVGCGHRASERFLESPRIAASTLTGIAFD